MEKTNSINLVQYFWFFVQTQIGISIMTLPYNIYHSAKTDGWISIILSGVVVQILIVIFWYLSSRFPNQTFFGMLESLLGKTFGKILSILYIVYFLFIATIVLLVFNFLIHVWVLNKTPDIVAIPLFVIASLYLLCSDLRIIGRFMAIAGPIILLAPICATYAFFDSEPLYLLPILDSDWLGIGKGIWVSSMSMQGFLIISIVYPFIKGTKKEIFLASTYANIMVTAIYTFIVIASFVYFSPGQFRILPEPLLYMIKTISLVLIERIDLVFLAFWSVVVLATIVSYLYMASIGMTTVFNQPKRLWFSLLSGVIISVLALIPQNILTVRRILGYIEYIGIAFIVIIPILLLTFSLLFKRSDTS
ncbi:GerAB/ArcD/ProY family transporter [Alkalicoccobacillus murimartini]|uniref:Spore germination protein (Amino acid permease) n=1 Tax=Alkalicoccobacillus murimartini TaxID=171685 RepID=A0ABT9YIS4_9BACI|nr:endospore germination permease [Alkalicoccobacillus murimartini]MDQ0207758.1 spore germination protein (amino acid permease) [Alkalicoccobacillus murimartini]